MTLADTLDSIAVGNTWSEAALIEAMDLEWITYDQWDAIENYLRGEQSGTDHIRLQEVAIGLRERA